MNLEETNEQLTNALGVLIEFLYLSQLRYQFNAKQAAEEVFNNFLKNNEEPYCIPAIKTCLDNNKFLINETDDFWDKDEIKKYLEAFMEHYDFLLSSQE